MRELQGLLEAEDLAASDHRVVAVEGRVADEHLIPAPSERGCVERLRVTGGVPAAASRAQNHSEGPPVAVLRVARLE